MTMRDIYETTFDEDVQPDLAINQCPECDGRVTTNAVETICDECGLVIDDQLVTLDSTWRRHSGDNRDQCVLPMAQGTVSADE